MNILFVCTGNTCRSPMAAAILAGRELSGVEVKSAGVFAMPGSQASHHAREVLKENGLKSEHSSAQVSDELIKWADYIFTMTVQHKMLLENSYPTSVGKTYTLKSFAEQHGEVIDPYGGSVEIYRDTFNELQEVIGLVIEKIKDK
ncbi:Low molecular weight protein-tyrosine-phosphatase YwlE [Bacillus sp. THAF10]|uniref:low molecular weight protein arginine phosphatase n=1 Tax=Bacillus sp. THAF10 TaxID=2587848 RepID=UPI0012685CF8|nr:low molecular weight protein arginine phosphatase [Bacillus sp. THAF10]QFT90941.1 Low molecular weight protein-tyrosine-phosphatase YwlE [Bacillus sp. THAF10]